MDESKMKMKTSGGEEWELVYVKYDTIASWGEWVGQGAAFWTKWDIDPLGRSDYVVCVKSLGSNCCIGIPSRALVQHTECSSMVADAPVAERTATEIGSDIHEFIDNIRPCEHKFGAIRAPAHLKGLDFHVCCQCKRAFVDSDFGDHTCNDCGETGLNPTPVVATEAYPHKCPKCGAPAYVGLNKIDCTAKCDSFPSGVTGYS